MQEHVKTEVAIELINAEIADVMKEMDIINSEKERQKLEEKWESLMSESQKIYQADPFAVDNILVRSQKRKRKWV